MKTGQKAKAKAGISRKKIKVLTGLSNQTQELESYTHFNEPRKNTMLL